MLDWNKVLYFAEVLQFGGIPWLSEIPRDYGILKNFLIFFNQIVCMFRLYI